MHTANSFRDDGFFTQRLDEAAKDPLFIDEMVDWYIGVFNASGPGEWNEHWTPDEVRRKPFLNVADHGTTTFFATWRVNGVIAGLNCACLGAPRKVVSLTDLPPGLQAAEHLDPIAARLEWFAGHDATVSFYREMGIRKEYRSGLEPVLGLMANAMIAARAAGSTFGCFWTGKDSKFYPIVRGVDIRDIYEFGDPGRHVFCGDGLDDTLRRLAMPKETIMKMLSRPFR